MGAISLLLSSIAAISLLVGGIGIMNIMLISVGINIAGGWATSITIKSVLLALVFSSSIGIIFGVYPALKAVKLNPIDALRSD